MTTQTLIVRLRGRAIILRKSTSRVSDYRLANDLDEAANRIELLEKEVQSLVEDQAGIDL